MKDIAVKPTFLKRHGSTIGFLIGMVLLGFLAQFQWVGNSIILLYAIIALWRKIPAKITFVAALLALAMVPIAILAANWLVAQNFAAYAFSLFVFGIVIMTVDLQRELSKKK